MALLPGSPAHNAAVGSASISDQRGFPIVGTPDIGAYEAGTVTNFNAWIYETLPATATIAQHAATFDFDGDGIANLIEQAFGLNPTQSSTGQLPQPQKIGANFVTTFSASVTGITYGAEWSSRVERGRQ